MEKCETKIYAMYLPQYHEIPENSKFWGKGFTDWVTVKKAEPLFEGHMQPQEPLNDNYYDLSKAEDVAEQVKLAKKYDVAGFGIYHYWFSSEKCILTKPAEIILEHKEFNLSFFLAWDNTSWKRTWSKLAGNDWAPIEDAGNATKYEGPEILIEYKLGNEQDWKKHFDYLLPFFKDSRYVKDNNKPLFLIFRFSDEIKEMAEYWNKLAIENGFSGVELVYSYNPLHGIPKDVMKFTYEPLFSGWGSVFDRVQRLITKNRIQTEVKIFNYDKVWRAIIRNAKYCTDKNRYYGGFVNYDDTPRRGNKGKVILGGTPEKFSFYLHQLKDISEKQNKRYIFLTAWNEWGEGAILEPNKESGFSYLEAYMSVEKGE